MTDIVQDRIDRYIRLQIMLLDALENDEDDATVILLAREQQRAFMAVADEWERQRRSRYLS